MAQHLAVAQGGARQAAEAVVAIRLLVAAGDTVDFDIPASRLQPREIVVEQRLAIARPGHADQLAQAFRSRVVLPARNAGLAAQAVGLLEHPAEQVVLALGATAVAGGTHQGLAQGIVLHAFLAAVRVEKAGATARRVVAHADLAAAVASDLGPGQVAVGVVAVANGHLAGAAQGIGTEHQLATRIVFAALGQAPSVVAEAILLPTATSSARAVAVAQLRPTGQLPGQRPVLGVPGGL
ncbi:Uncharacterised protein [Klebsiella pneumoniae]|nr:Uncharacterised protein [Klebsiella pneumoniae]